MSQLLQSLSTNHDTDMRISDAEIKRLMAMLKPYSTKIPGTPMYIQVMRHNVLSLIMDSMVKLRGVFTWFLTMAPVDTHGPVLFTQYLQSLRKTTWEDASAYAALLSMPEREDILRRHPALAVRNFLAKQSAFKTCVLNGESQPLGDITDWFERTEFQRGGSPHTHGMYAIRNGPSATAIHGTDIEQEHVKRIVDATLTASIIQVNDNDTTRPEEYTHPVDTIAVDDDPRRLHFDASLDYRHDTPDGSPRDERVRQLFKNLQLAGRGGFFHTCTFTCWKYNKKWDKTCRFGFVRPLGLNVEIRTEKRKGKRREITRVEPVRNNGHLNAMHRSPLFALAHAANYDLQFCANARGAAEYM